MNKPENTSSDDPMKTLMLMMGLGNDAIPLQEAQGQQSFVVSDTLPTQHMGQGTTEALESMGIVFGDIVEGDPLFQYVELPKGWQKVAESHAMWSKLVDDKGRVRANIFYKAAFYDRSAHITAARRYLYGVDYVQQKLGFAVALVKRDNDVIFQSDKFPIEYPSQEAFRRMDQCKAQAKQWLMDHYPDYMNPCAYWDND